MGWEISPSYMVLPLHYRRKMAARAVGSVGACPFASRGVAAGGGCRRPPCGPPEAPPPWESLTGGIRGRRETELTDSVSHCMRSPTGEDAAASPSRADGGTVIAEGSPPLQEGSLWRGPHWLLKTAEKGGGEKGKTPAVPNTEQKARKEPKTAAA